MDGYIIGIFMTPLSIHYNRSPVDGKIILKHYIDSSENETMTELLINILLILLRKKTKIDERYYLSNERLTWGIRNDLGDFFVIQIADKWIRKIDSWKKCHESVTKGEQIGMIKFGSQCDLIIPESLYCKLKIQVGDYVKAGQTII